MTMGIYAIVHVPSGDRYVGSSTCIEDRCRAHLKCSSSEPLSDAIRVRGIHTFECVVLEVVDSAKDLTAKEQLYIAEGCKFNKIMVASRSRGGTVRKIPKRGMPNPYYEDVEPQYLAPQRIADDTDLFP